MKKQNLKWTLSKKIKISLFIIILGVVTESLIAFDNLGIWIMGGGLSLLIASVRPKDGKKEDEIAEITSRIPSQGYILKKVVINGTIINNIFISSKGVFIIQAVNKRGAIYGDASREKWTQVIEDSDGHFYKNTFPNPIETALYNDSILCNYLKQQTNIKTKVQTIIVFTHPAAELNVFSAQIPILYLYQLKQYLNNFNDLSISSQQVLNLVSNLKQAFNK